MKILVIACTLAFASATYYQKYKGPQHIPVLDKHGVPVDTLEVQHARSAHLNQVAAAKYTSGKTQSPINSYDNIKKYHGPQHIPIIGKLGVPLDTKDVQHARAEHFLHRSQIEANIAEQKSREEDSSSSEEDYEDLSSEEDSSEDSQELEYESQFIPIGFKGVPEVDKVQQAAHLPQYYH